MINNKNEFSDMWPTQTTLKASAFWTHHWGLTAITAWQVKLFRSPWSIKTARQYQQSKLRLCTKTSVPSTLESSGYQNPVPAPALTPAREAWPFRTPRESPRLLRIPSVPSNARRESHALLESLERWTSIPVAPYDHHHRHLPRDNSEKRMSPRCKLPCESYRLYSVLSSDVKFPGWWLAIMRSLSMLMKNYLKIFSIPSIEKLKWLMIIMNE